MKGMNSLLLGCILFQLVLGLGNKPTGMQVSYRVCSFGFALVMVITTISIVGLACISSVSLLSSKVLFVSFLASSGALQFIAAVLHQELHHLLGGLLVVLSVLAGRWVNKLTLHIFLLAASYLQYMLMLPTLSLTLPVYALSNLHDLSWGTKGADVDTKDEETEELFARFRTTVLVSWIAANIFAVGLAQSLDPTGAGFLKTLISLVTAINCFRFTGSMVFLVNGWRHKALRFIRR